MDDLWDLIADLADDPVFWIFAPTVLIVVVALVEIGAHIATGSWIT